MGNIFIKQIDIKNYKCFDNESVGFNVPDGQNEGSGLNILIGENGNGKTTILEAINYLTLNSFSAENKLKINDFYNFNEKILIEGHSEVFGCKSSIDLYNMNNWSFKAKGFSFEAVSRNSKERGKLLSSCFDIKNNYILNNDNYFKGDGSTATDKGGNIKPIDSRDKIFSNSRIIDDEINVFFFDKNRTRQITSGTYKTTFEKICDDLNWKFVKEVNKDKIKKGTIIQNVCSEYFANVIGITQKGAGSKLADDLKNFFDNDEYQKIKIELLDLLHPFSNSFFALRDEEDLKQINTKDLGSGVEMILTLLLLQSIAKESKGSIIYLIDEPELHLHPKAQEKLIELLMVESKDKQIFISTHSPYIFKNCLLADVGLKLFYRENGKIEIADAKDKDWGLFPWSPSWGEINYQVYNLPTIELHNELYGYIQEKTGKYYEDDFDNYLVSQNLQKDKKWTPERNGAVQTEKDVSLQTFIRNKIHHPENTTMQKDDYNDQDLKKSIDEMIGIAKKLN